MRRNSLDILIKDLFELTTHIWQVGAVVSILLAILTVALFIGVTSFVIGFEATEVLKVLEKVVWLAYILPLISGFFFYVFSVKTYRVYCEQNCI